jgi:hypothetical protein
MVNTSGHQEVLYGDMERGVRRLILVKMQPKRWKCK